MTESTAALSPAQTLVHLGQITRQLHEALTALGLEQDLQAIAQEIPDARDRLSHVGRMTEAAATQVLNLIDQAQPGCETFERECQVLAQSLAQMVASGTPPNWRELIGTCQMFAQMGQSFAETQHGVLTDIMMTQDFQDLSGQIIKKVIDIISHTEAQLVQLLVHSVPPQAAAPTAQPSLAGPLVPEKAMKQNDVDDLLASLGF